MHLPDERSTARLIDWMLGQLDEVRTDPIEGPGPGSSVGREQDHVSAVPSKPAKREA